MNFLPNFNSLFTYERFIFTQYSSWDFYITNLVDCKITQLRTYSQVAHSKTILGILLFLVFQFFIYNSSKGSLK